MEYALIIYNDVASRDASPEELRPLYDRFMEVLERPNVTGVVRLQEFESATTVRYENGRTLLTDGPFVESKEYLGGVIVYEAANLDEALAVAKHLQEGRGWGAIEVRPLMPFDVPPGGAGA